MPLILLLALACTGTAPDDTAQSHETGTPPGDTGGSSGDDTGDDTGGDTGGSTGSWGEISGSCGDLGGALALGSPALLRNSIDFGTIGFDEAAAGAEALELIADGNLGGSSIHSEAVAMEVLDRCEGADLLLTEAEIQYTDPGGKKTDIYVDIDGIAVGISVTRAFHYPPEEGYTVAEGEALLEDKLADVLLSEANAAAANPWTHSVLSVIAWDSAAGDAIEAAWASVTEVQDDTILLLTVTEGEDDFVY